MKIVIDTNVVISAVFFGGNPQKIIEAVVDGDFHAFATPAIIEEYCEIVDEMVKRKQAPRKGGLSYRRQVVPRLNASLSLSAQPPPAAPQGPARRGQHEEKGQKDKEV